MLVSLCSPQQPAPGCGWGCPRGRRDWTGRGDCPLAWWDWDAALCLGLSPGMAGLQCNLATRMGKKLTGQLHRCINLHQSCSSAARQTWSQAQWVARGAHPAWGRHRGSPRRLFVLVNVVRPVQSFHSEREVQRERAARLLQAGDKRVKGIGLTRLVNKKQ